MPPGSPCTPMRKKIPHPKPTPAPTRHASRWLWLALVLCLAVHIGLAFHIELAVDEAHYALYAAHPALSYFDHPPLVGWIQMPFVWLGGADWMMRIVPITLWLLTAWLLARDSKWALLLLLQSLTHHLLGLGLLPDSLLFPLTLVVMVLTHRLTRPSARMTDWLWLGIALGLAGLSKYTGIFLALGVAIVLLSQYGWPLFRQRGLWLATAIAGIMILPVVMWNAQQDWISLAYQFNHASGEGNSWDFKRIGLYSLIQLMSYGLLPLVGLIAFYAKQRAHSASTEPGIGKICAAFGLPWLVTMVFISAKGAALPHWTSGAWVALFPAAALGLHHLWHHPSTLVRRVGRLLVSVLMGLQAIIFALLVFAMATGAKPLGSPGNPFTDFYDWSAGAAKARQVQMTHHADALAVTNWSLASRLAWYARPSKVWALDEKNKQFEMWFGKLEYGQSFIWVDWSQAPQPHPVGCRRLSGEEASYQGEHSRFDFYVCGRP